MDKNFFVDLSPGEQILAAALAVLVLVIVYRAIVRMAPEGFASPEATKLANEAKELFDEDPDASVTTFKRRVADADAVKHRVTRRLHQEDNLNPDQVQASLY
jgi:type II secretory pathway component PulM